MKFKKPKVYKKFFNAFPDERGFLTAFDLEKIQKKLDVEFNYQLVSLSKKKFTFRGFHYQKEPKAQNKIIAIHSGQIIDFAVDINFPSSLNIKNFRIVCWRYNSHPKKLCSRIFIKN
jgi:dTDP-4-dehydrorhamnose 3,5-epimerase-like enzyme